MTGHFGLDAEPGALTLVARRWGETAEHLQSRGRRATGAPDRWRSGWRSPSAEVIGAQACDLGSHLDDFAGHYGEAAEALEGFAGALRTAIDVDVPDLNRRWTAAQTGFDDAVSDSAGAQRRAVDDLPDDLDPADRREAVRVAGDRRREADRGAARALDAAQQQLEAEYDELCEGLRCHARRLSGVLAHQVAVPVPPALVAAYDASRASWLGSTLWQLGGGLLTDLLSGAADRLGGPLEDLRDELADPPDDLEGLTDLLDRARELGVPPDQYAAVLESYWQHRSAEAAGIDLSEWDPSKGADANREIIEAVYRYYGDLYLENPDLQWAGMANMIGPSFAAGFFDLDAFRGFAETLADVPWPLDQALPPGMEALAGMSAEELRFYETTFLDMQRQIFFDQGSMHQAYVDGGLEAIREMEAAGLIEPEVADAWEGLDGGDPEQVQEANELFLWREQHEIIDDDYQLMYDRPGTGPAMTWAMTQIGTPSIPGARGYPDVDPLTITYETPGPHDLGPFDNPLQGQVSVETPFAGGNIAHFDDRWHLIEEDTLPVFQELLAEDPDRAREIIAASVPDRIDDYRLDQQIDDILGQLLDWEADLDQ